jgi:hypothetical protein
MLSMGHKVNTLVAWRIMWNATKGEVVLNKTKHTQTYTKALTSLSDSFEVELFFKFKKEGKTWTHWTSINRLKSSMFVHFYTLNKHSFTIQQWFNINCKMHLNIVTHKHNQASNLTFCHLSISFYFVLSKLG